MAEAIDDAVHTTDGDLEEDTRGTRAFAQMSRTTHRNSEDGRCYGEKEYDRRLNRNYSNDRPREEFPRFQQYHSFGGVGRPPFPTRLNRPHFRDHDPPDMMGGEWDSDNDRRSGPLPPRNMSPSCELRGGASSLPPGWVGGDRVRGPVHPPRNFAPRLGGVGTLPPPRFNNSFGGVPTPRGDDGPIPFEEFLKNDAPPHSEEFSPGDENKYNREQERIPKTYDGDNASSPAKEHQVEEFDSNRIQFTEEEFDSKRTPYGEGELNHPPPITDFTPDDVEQQDRESGVGNAVVPVVTAPSNGSGSFGVGGTNSSNVIEDYDNGRGVGQPSPHPHSLHHAMNRFPGPPPHEQHMRGPPGRMQAEMQGPYRPSGPPPRPDFHFRPPSNDMRGVPPFHHHHPPGGMRRPPNVGESGPPPNWMRGGPNFRPPTGEPNFRGLPPNMDSGHFRSRNFDFSMRGGPPRENFSLQHIVTGDPHHCQSGNVGTSSLPPANTPSDNVPFNLSQSRKDGGIEISQASETSKESLSGGANNDNVITTVPSIEQNMSNRNVVPMGMSSGPPMMAFPLRMGMGGMRMGMSGHGNVGGPMDMNQAQRFLSQLPQAPRGPPFFRPQGMQRMSNMQSYLPNNNNNCGILPLRPPFMQTQHQDPLRQFGGGGPFNISGGYGLGTALAGFNPNMAPPFQKLQQSTHTPDFPIFSQGSLGNIEKIPYSGGLSTVSNSFPNQAHASVNPLLTEEEIWVENSAPDGKAYYYNMKTRGTRWDRPGNVKIVKQSDVEATLSMTTAGGPSNQLPVSGATFPSAATVSHTTVSSSSTAVSSIQEWMQYLTPEGRPYYHNVRSGETVWEKPHALVEYEKSLAAAQAVVQAKNLMLEAAKAAGTDTANTEQPPNTTASISQPVEMSEANTTDESDESASDGEDDDQEEEGGTSRPISSNPISGTPWCVVWTADRRVFFYNPSLRASVWDKPDELIGRSDVDKLLDSPPVKPNGQMSITGENTGVKREAVDSTDGNPSKRAKYSDDNVKSGDSNSSASETDDKKPVTATAVAIVASDQLSSHAVAALKKQQLDTESAKEKEQRAAQLRATLALDTRIKQFRELLMEKQVSVYSTWKQELHKIVFDERYLLLTSKERKDAFEDYVKERAEAERHEKKQKMKEARDKFKQFLKDIGANARMSFSDVSSRHSRDERFKAVEKPKEREAIFYEFISEIKKGERDGKSKKREEIKQNFMELLTEAKSITKKSKWSDVRKKLVDDSRYKAIESSTRREELFKSFIRTIDEVDTFAKKDRDRKEREEASLREREKEVKEALSSSLRERDKERDAQQQKEAITAFRALLIDVVKDRNMPWKDVKRSLEKDQRWNTIGDALERSERDQIYKDHVDSLSRKLKDTFYRLLDDNSSKIALDATYKRAKKLIKKDPRFEKFTTDDKKREHEFKKWIDKRIGHAKLALRELLIETKIITHKSKMAMESGDSHWKEILGFIKNDKRFTCLSVMEDMRTKVIMDYIDEVAHKGPRPPVTASEPNSARRK